MSSDKFRFPTITAIVIANMVGTGVFTSLGFQLLEIQSGFVILLLWILGGVVAVCGAMTYAELGAAFPRSGGEYNLLSEIYHPAVGFVAGWTSITIGFAGPSALAAMTFAAYMLSIVDVEVSVWLERGFAVSLVAVLTLVHAGRRRNSGRVQVIFTVLKVTVIVVFCAVVALLVDESQRVRFTPVASDTTVIGSGAFAVALVYVSYAYTGWNAATYLSSELRHPQRTLPVILLSGTLVVTVLYVALNFVFLLAAPIADLQGQVEVGLIAARAAFGEEGGRFAGLALALLLVSTVSAMMMAGPRVLQVMGEDYRPLRFFAQTNHDGIPGKAIYFQSGLAILFIFSSSFESVLLFAGFTLALNSFVTVLGVFVLRRRHPRNAIPYRTPLFPLPPLVYLLLMGWTLGYVLITRPVEGLFGLSVIVSGLIVFAFCGRIAPQTESTRSTKAEANVSKAEQLEKIKTAPGFIAALDQSGGSTPKALGLYGVTPDAWSSDDEMFAVVHAMRTRIMMSPSFGGERILGAILFENTMDREVDGQSTASYLWNVKNVVPFLKVDKGLADVVDGAQIMNPMPDLDALLEKAQAAGIFGTKMRSVIKEANAAGIQAVVEQQFEIGRRIVAAGLIPIIEPEVDIHCAEKAAAEDILKAAIMEHLNGLNDDEIVMLKLTLPEKDGLFDDCVAHPNVARVVALSGGYSREEANDRLSRQHGMVASFSRALSEGLAAQQSDDEFNATLDTSIASIAAASAT